MLIDAWWFWCFVAVFVFWALGAYNRLMRLRNQIIQQYFALEAVLFKYQDLVQEAITSAATATNGWRASVAPELGASLWTRLQVCANHAAMAMARMHEHPLLPKSADELVETSEELESAWLSLVHPDVYYLSVPEVLKKNWSDIDVLLQPELEKFNTVSIEYNKAIDMFPALIIAKVFNFKPARTLT
jgi:LemA protein